MENAKWENWINFAIGTWLCLAPWMLPGGVWEGRLVGASWNFWISGTIILVSSALAIWNLKPWEEWVNLVVGVWLCLAPWVFRYSGYSWFLWTSVISGIIVVVLSLLALPVALKPARQRVTPRKM